MQRGADADVSDDDHADRHGGHTLTREDKKIAGTALAKGSGHCYFAQRAPWEVQSNMDDISRSQPLPWTGSPSPWTRSISSSLGTVVPLLLAWLWQPLPQVSVGRRTSASIKGRGVAP